MSQTIATFANTTARDEAIDSPAEGQVVYIENTASFLWWTGADWEDFGGAPTLTANRAVATNGSGELAASTVTATELGYLSGATSNIQTQINGIGSGALVKITDQSFTSASSVNVNSVFSSTYRNYHIVATWTGSGNQDIYFRWRASGTDNTSAQYNSGGYFSNNVNLNQGAATFHWIGATGGTTASSLSMTVYRPFVSGVTTGMTALHTGERSTYYNIGGLSTQGGVANTTAYDGFTIYTSTGTFTGNLTVYGIVN
jgi:hypothetical protein